MQVDSTQVIVDKSEDPFKDFGPAIVGNIVNYNRYTDENEKKEENKQKEEKLSVEKLIGDVRDSVEAITTSVPHATMLVTPSTPPTQVATMQYDDEVEAQNLISSLSKLFEKKKLVKSIEKTLISILDRLEKIVSFVDTSIDIQ